MTGVVPGSSVGLVGVPVIGKMTGGNGGVGVAAVGARVVTTFSSVAVEGTCVVTGGQGVVVVAVVVAGSHGVAVAAGLLLGK